VEDEFRSLKSCNDSWAWRRLRLVYVSRLKSKVGIKDFS
jgi:hypothetical protein